MQTSHMAETMCMGIIMLLFANLKVICFSVRELSLRFVMEQI